MSSYHENNIDLGLMNDHIKNILVTISQNPVTNVVAPTGVGKTTKLPIGIAEAGNKIVVVVSNDNLANSLSDYVKTLTKVGVSNNLSGNDNIRYVSESTIKNYLYNKNNDLGFTDILMIDQADRGSLDQDLIIALWKYSANRNIRVPRLLLVSNTVIKHNIQNINEYIIDNTYYPIEIRYYNKNYSLSSYEDGSLVRDTINLVYDLHISDIKGDILIFTSGKLQIDDIVSKLNDMNIDNIQVIAAHEDISKDDIDIIYKKSERRKVIVTDELGETTFTLDYVGPIIDMMIGYQKDLSLTGGQRYSKKYISQSQSNLRANRGGKNVPTICYRMISNSMFNLLLNERKSEIHRVPLHWTMLELIQYSIDPFKVLDMYDNQVLDRMYMLIIRLGLVNTAGRVTNKGKFCLKINYGIRQAAALYEWLEKEYPPYPAIVLLSMIDSYGEPYYLYPLLESGISHAEYNLELLEHRKTYFEPFVGNSDLHTYGNIWTLMMDEVGGPDVPSSDIYNWCKDNYISYNNISEVVSLNRSIINVLSEDLSNIEIGPFNTDNLLDLLGPILKDVYSDKTLYISNNSGVRIIYLDNNKNEYKVDSMNGINTIDMDTPDVIYGLITSRIESKYGSSFDTIICSLV